MKQLILLVFTCLSVLLVQAQVRGPVAGQATQEEREKVLNLAQEEGDLSIYPNPNTGIFTVSLSNNDARKAELRIMNVIGNEVHHETITRTDGQLSTVVDLNRFAKGLYYVKLEADNFSVVRRVVVK